MTALQGVLIGFVFGAVAAMVCIWIAGGSLYGKKMEGEEDGQKQD